MQYIIIGNQSNKNNNISLSMKKQEKWRQKQIDIYYKKGRPIFKNMNHYTTLYGFNVK